MKVIVNIVIVFMAWLAPGCLLAQGQIHTNEASTNSMNTNQILQYREQVFVHTDKPYYLTGETLWFKAYCTNLKNNQPLSVSKVLYLELIDPYGQPIVQVKTSLDKGVGRGQVLLNSKLPTGTYLFRAYTQAMRNYSEQDFYQQKIIVLNPLVSLPEDTTHQKDHELKLGIFPEGGSLVAGLASKVTVVVKNRFGQGVESQLEVFDEKDSVVASINTHANGVGSFSITPENLRYYAIAKFGNQQSAKSYLGEIQTSGLVISAKKAVNEDSRRLTIKSRFSTPAKVHLLVHQKDSVYLTENIELNNSPTNLTLSERTLPHGISYLTILDSNDHILSQRPVSNYSALHDYLLIDTDKETYTARERVTLELSGLLENTRGMDLSVSVYPAYQGLGTDQDVVAHWVYNSKHTTTNMLAGAMEDFTEEQIDDLILTAEWNHGQWPDKKFKPTVQYFPETVGPVVYGSSAQLNDTYGDHRFVSISGKGSRIYELVSTKPGEFAAVLPKGTELQHLYFWSITDSGAGVNIKSSFDPRIPALSNEVLQFDSSTISHIEKQSVNMQISNLYQEYTSIHGRSVGKESSETMFYGQPEFQYLLDEYTRFPTLEEVIIEYVRNVSIRRSGGKIDLHVWDEYANIQSLANNIFFDRPALLMLDGVPVNDTEWVLNIDVLKIRSIEVVTKRYFVGNTAFSGIINMTTYNNDFGGLDLPAIITPGTISGFTKKIGISSSGS